MIRKMIKQYKILEEIGSGGMSVVYRAEDTVLERIVALKVLSKKLKKDSKTSLRFLREAQAVARLEHPNVCILYEIGDEKGQYFISMAYVDGQSLREKLKEGPLAIDETIDIALQIADALNAAHKKYIIHRDIKPANIMINTEGVVKILDFGLAKLIGKRQITRPGEFLGTIVYISPEQAIGKTVDYRTDIWSLGAVMYRMLTGERPFKGRSVDKMFRALLKDTPERIRNLREDVPESLEDCVHKMMEKGRQFRQRDMAEVIEDLKSVKTARV